jgi:HK97 family phage major capsid protein
MSMTTEKPKAPTSAAEIRQESESKARELQSAQQQILDLLQATKNEATGQRLLTPEQAERVRRLEGDAARLTDEVNALKMDYLAARATEELAKGKAAPFVRQELWEASGGGPGPDGRGLSKAMKMVQELPDTLGDAFIEAPSFKSWRHGSAGQNAWCEVPAWGMRDFAEKSAVKATLATTGLTSYLRPPETIMLGQQQLTVADLFANGQTDSPTIRYLQEVSFTNAATTVAEGAAKPEATWDLAEVDAAVRKIAVLTRVTDETFADYPQVRSYINDRLPFMVRQREELQLLNGDGIAPNLLGVLNVAGILTQAKGADTNVDAIYKGITAVRTQGFFEPDGIVIDPTNWTPIRLLKTTTGEYVWGAPSVMGPETLFGKRVVVTVNMVDNTALVGAFRIGGTVFYRQGLRIEATNSNEDDFRKNLILLRAEQREALAVWRAKAFCTVTGLGT